MSWDEPNEGYTALCSDAEGDTLRAYALLYAGREWPEHAAVTYLRILESERRTGRRKASAWPTVRELAEAWNWKTPKGPAKDRAATFLTRTRVVETKRGLVTILHWQDAYRHASLDELRGDRAMGVNRPGARKSPDGDPTVTRREPDGDPTAGTDEPAQSDGVSDGDPTVTRREPDGDPTPCASSPRASTDPQSTSPQGETHRNAGEAPAPPVQPSPTAPGTTATAGGSAGVRPKAPGSPDIRPESGPQVYTPRETLTADERRDSKGTGATTATATKLAEEHQLWSIYRAHHPRCDAGPTKANAKALRAILGECGGLDPAGTYLAWVHQSQDRHARQLRGEDPWPDGDRVERTDLVSLARNIPPRLTQALTWDARGRTAGPHGSPPGRGPPPRQPADTMDDLFARSPPPHRVVIDLPPEPP